LQRTGVVPNTGIGHYLQQRVNVQRNRKVRKVRMLVHTSIQGAMAATTPSRGCRTFFSCEPPQSQASRIWSRQRPCHGHLHTVIGMYTLLRNLAAPRQMERRHGSVKCEQDGRTSGSLKMRRRRRLADGALTSHLRPVICLCVRCRDPSAGHSNIEPSVGWRWALHVIWIERAGAAASGTTAEQPAATPSRAGQATKLPSTETMQSLVYC
jgi:hypothetical protein